MKNCSRWTTFFCEMEPSSTFPVEEIHKLLNKELEIAMSPTLTPCKSKWFGIGEHRDKIILKKLMSVDLKYPKPKPTSELSFIGMLMGRNFRTGEGVMPPFAPLVWKCLSGEEVTLGDVSLIDPDVSRTITELSNSVSTQMQYLELNINDIKLDMKKIALILGTSSKKALYALANLLEPYYIEKEAEHILKGITRVVPYPFLDVFCAHEWEEIFSRNPDDLKLSYLHESAMYSGYSESSLTVKLFWKAIKDFEPYETLLVKRLLSGNCNQLSENFQLRIAGTLEVRREVGCAKSLHVTRLKDGCILYIPNTSYSTVKEMRCLILERAWSYHFNSIAPVWV